MYAIHRDLYNNTQVALALYPAHEGKIYGSYIASNGSFFSWLHRRSKRKPVTSVVYTYTYYRGNYVRKSRRRPATSHKAKQGLEKRTGARKGRSQRAFNGRGKEGSQKGGEKVL